MKRAELLARILITVFSLGVIALPLALWARTPIIHARIAESGGWSPDVLQAKVGEALHLHLTSDDVTHGFAIGQKDMESVDVEPGKVTDLTLTFDKPGTYTFFCTRWCGLNHWRMRGTIEVTGDGTNAPESAASPLYVTLGLDIDAPHNAAVIPDIKPSGVNSEQLIDSLPSTYFSADYYRSHSPAQAFTELRADPFLNSLGDTNIWNLVASVWRSNTTPDGLANGQKIFAQNCAACHGEKGAGNGVFADDLAAAGKASAQTMSGAQEMVMQTPGDFTDPARMLGASPALLQGKILRGGMGTGMPSWGPIFTEQQIWDVISYLYSFQFGYSK
jgi:mono/diheme cytochrome c family protein/plastocyanin